MKPARQLHGQWLAQHRTPEIEPIPVQDDERARRVALGEEIAEWAKTAEITSEGPPPYTEFGIQFRKEIADEPEPHEPS